jgi:hypothetical protein
MNGVIGLLVILVMIAGCGRRLPPDCREFLEKTDFGRFEIKDRGIALDSDLGIEWFRCSVGQRFLNDNCIGEPLLLRWESGVDMVQDINEKMGGDWRLPSRSELASLRIRECGNPSVNTNVFPAILVDNYWARDKSPHSGFRCGMYTYSGATSCRLFDNLERPILMVRDVRQ